MQYLFPGSTKPLPEPMSTNDQWDSVALIEDQFHNKCLRYQIVKWYNSKLSTIISQGPMILKPALVSIMYAKK